MVLGKLNLQSSAEDIIASEVSEDYYESCFHP